MEKTNFEKLQVYNLSEKLADEIWNIVIKWDNFAKNTVGIQIVKSADSVGANIAEGTGRTGIKDKKRFITISRGSLYETIHWLRRSYKRKLLTKEQVGTIKEIINELSPKLNAYYKSIGKTKTISN